VLYSQHGCQETEPIETKVRRELRQVPKTGPGAPLEIREAIREREDFEPESFRRQVCTCSF
jgi:hypothetical protein